MVEEGIQYTGVHCANKWKSFKREYSAIIDHNAKSGNEPKRCKFYTELNQLYDNKPSTRPGFSLDSMGYTNPPQPLPAHLIQVHLHLVYPQALLVSLLLVQPHLAHQLIRPVKFLSNIWRFKCLQ